MNIQRVKTYVGGFRVVNYLADRYRNRTRPFFRAISPIVETAKALEVGGPTPLFSRRGALPVYPIVADLDNSNWSDETFWSQIEEGRNFVFDKKRRPGRQIISDAVNLEKIDAETYDLVISSHVIEHIANPIKALRQWARVLKKDGHLLIVAPDKRYTYDRNRPVTTIEHLIADFESDMPESDDTHFEEIIALHDVSVDSTVPSYEEHVRRTKCNFEHRIAHQHVFDEAVFRSMVEYAGFDIKVVDVFRPYHLVIFARKRPEAARA